MTYGNGTSRSFAYDTVSRLTGLKANPAGTANDLPYKRPELGPQLKARVMQERRSDCFNCMVSLLA